MSPSTRRETISVSPWCRSACSISPLINSGASIIRPCSIALFSLNFAWSRRLSLQVAVTLSHFRGALLERPRTTASPALVVAAGRVGLGQRVRPAAGALPHPTCAHAAAGAVLRRRGAGRGGAHRNRGGDTAP